MDIALSQTGFRRLPALYWTKPPAPIKRKHMTATERSLDQLIDIRMQGNVSDQLFNRLSQLILSGSLPAGYVFPNETALCEQLHIGRTSLREAYKALELSGFITRTKRGTRVNERSDILRAAPLRALFTDADDTDFSEFRHMVEVECAGLAAARASSDDVDVLLQCNDACNSANAAHHYRDLFYADMAFHQQVAQASGNKLVIDIAGVMREALEYSVLDNFLSVLERDAAFFDEAIGQHARIIEAIRRHDAQAARDAMADHVRSVSTNAAAGTA